MIQEEYNLLLPLLQKLENEAVYILEDWFSDIKFKYDRIESRIKTWDSILDKITRKDLNDQLDSITDVLGLRIICLFIADLDKVRESLYEVFEIISEDDKVNNGDIDRFGYQSVHYIVQLKDSYSGPRYKKIKKIQFEIQVRTIAMHSWANISHHLSYKKDTDVPKELLKDFYALSGLFHIADKLYQEFNIASQKHNKVLINTDYSKILDSPLNLDTFKAYIRNKIPERSSSNNEDLSELISELKAFGINKIRTIDNVYNKCFDVFTQYEKDHPASDEMNTVPYIDIGIIRIMFSILSDEFIKIRGVGSLKKQYVKYRELLPDLSIS